MKSVKKILPMLAFIFAVGVAFATTEIEGDNEAQPLDYYKVGNSWQSVPEQDCGEGPYTCRVQFGATGTPYDLYDNMGDINPKDSSSNHPIIL